MKYNLPQNCLIIEEENQDKDGFYKMDPGQTLIFPFILENNNLIKIGIANISVDSEDLSLTTWFTRKPLDIRLFPENSGVNPCYVKKNYSYDEMYSGSNGSRFVIYDSKFPNIPKHGVESLTPHKDNNKFDVTIDSMKETPSYTNMKGIIRKINELIVYDNNQEFYFMNIQNLQNKPKSIRLLFSNTNTDYDPLEDLDNHPNRTEQTNQYMKKNSGDYMSNFRYPSQGRPSF